MKIGYRGFAGNNHSWSCCAWGISTALVNLGHQVEVFSTDGIKCLPDNLKNNLIGYSNDNEPNKIYGRLPNSSDYDLAISYTAMKNFPAYLGNAKNKLGIWVWEWAGQNSLPSGFAKNYKACDYLCAPSEFGKRVFMQSGIPESAIKVIPHGVNESFFNETSTIELPTKKKFKILSNIAQNHLRKNIPGLLEAYGKAFTNKDDVCLILKAKHKPVSAPFDISLQDCLNNFYQAFPKHAEIKLFSDFIPDISALYRSVDASFTMSFCEGFYFPALEIISAGKIAIAPNWGGQVDFLNDSNALLIDGKEVRADPKSMYWESKPNAIWFKPSVDDAVEKLRYAYSNFETLNKQVEFQRSSVKENYSWSTVVKRMLELCR